MTTEQLKQLKEVLIRTVGDKIQCPHCRDDFVPDTPTSQMAWKLYKELFGVKGNKKKKDNQA